MGKKCICEICVCGRHRCPHRPQAWKQASNLGPCALSEYRQTFKQFDVRPPQSFKPHNKPFASTSKLEAKTTNQCDYVAHSPVRRLSFGRTIEYQKPTDPMLGETEYMREYPEKKRPALQSPVHRWDASRTTQNESAPFQASTTQREDFKAWAIQAVPRETLKKVNIYIPPKEKFEMLSTFQSDYRANGPVIPCEMVKPIHSSIKSEAPFDDTTTNRVDYKKPPPAPRTLVKKYQPVVVKRDKFDATTTNRQDFVPHMGIERPKCTKPALEQVKSTEPFKGETTHSVSYIPWELQPRFEHPKQEYQPSPEKFDHISTNQSDYRDYGRVERVLPRPIENFSNEHQPFTADTTHRLDYQAWAVKARDRLAQRQNEYKPIQSPFEGQSTFQAHFQGKPAAPAKSAKPLEPKLTSGQFNGQTIYRETYTPKDMTPCPAAFLRDVYTPPVKDQYVYSHQARTGHKFYQPLTEYNTRLSKSMPEMKQS